MDQTPTSEIEREFMTELQSFIDIVNRISEEAQSFTMSVNRISEEAQSSYNRLRPMPASAPLSSITNQITTQSIQTENIIHEEMEDTRIENPRPNQTELMFQTPLPSTLLNTNIVDTEPTVPTVETGLLNPHINHYGINVSNSCPYDMGDGTLVWMKFGKIHRGGDLPAIITPNGSKYWIKRGLQHRDRDLPAVIIHDNSLFIWMKNGRIHRDNDRPAIECTLFKKWFTRGVLHRDIRPAVINIDGYEWYQHGKLHSIGDCPSIIKISGRMMWHKQGLLHRDEDKPAVISYKRMEWFQDGKRHRGNDLPAIIANDGSAQFWENGVQVINNVSGEDTIATIGELTCCVCLINKPAVIDRKCRHLCLCISCADIITNRDQKCPICRGELDDLVRVYI